MERKYLNTVVELYNLDQLSEQRSAEALMFFQSSVEKLREGNEDESARNAAEFLKILGADELEDKERQEVISKTTFLVETITKDLPISKDLYSWDTGLWSRCRKDTKRPRKIADYSWETKPGKIHENIKIASGFLGQQRAGNEDKEGKKIDKSQFRWKEDRL